MSDKYGVNLAHFQTCVNEYTREEIAAAIGCDQSLVTKHYNGDRNITIDYVVKYAKFFNVSTDYLLGLASEKIALDTEEGRKISEICEYTGLSEGAVTRLNEWERNNSGTFFPKRKDFLNTLLTSECIEAVCVNAENYIDDMQLAVKYLKKWKRDFEEKDKSEEKSVGIMIADEEKIDELIYRMELPQFRASKHIISLFEQFAEPDKSEYESLNIFYQRNRITVEER